MKTTGAGASEEPNKSSLTKVSKKSTKSRSKNVKLDTSNKNAAPVPGVVSATVGSLPVTPSLVNLATTPTTPTTSLGNYNLFDASFAVSGNTHGIGVEAAANANANRVVSELCLIGWK